MSCLCASSSIFLFLGPFLWVPPLPILRMVPSILQGSPLLPPVFISFMRFLLQSFISKSFFVLRKYFFIFFVHLHLFDCIHLQYSQALVVFNLSNRPYAFWVISSVPSTDSLFARFIFNMAHFNSKFHSYILVVYSYCLYQGLQFLFYFLLIHCVIPIHKVLYIF